MTGAGTSEYSCIFTSVPCVAEGRDAGSLSFSTFKEDILGERLTCGQLNSKLQDCLAVGMQLWKGWSQPLASSGLQAVVMEALYPRLTGNTVP